MSQNNVPVTLILFLRRRAGRGGTDDFRRNWSLRAAEVLDLPGLVRRERFVTVSGANGVRAGMPEFGAKIYDGLDFLEFRSSAELEDAIASGQIASALHSLAASTSVASSCAAVTRERVVFGPSRAALVTIGCLKRQPSLSWNEFDDAWSAHTRLTDALREAGVLAGYVQSHLLGPDIPELTALEVGGVTLPWAEWDGITRGFWPSEEALQARTEMTEWLAECSADEARFIDHARSLNQLTVRRPVN